VTYDNGQNSYKDLCHNTVMFLLTDHAHQLMIHTAVVFFCFSYRILFLCCMIWEWFLSFQKYKGSENRVDFSRPLLLQPQAHRRAEKHWQRMRVMAWSLISRAFATYEGITFSTWSTDWTLNFMYVSLINLIVALILVRPHLTLC